MTHNDGANWENLTSKFTALNVPWSKNANDDGTFKSDEELGLYLETTLRPTAADPNARIRHATPGKVSRGFRYAQSGSAIAMFMASRRYFTSSGVHCGSSTGPSRTSRSTSEATWTAWRRRSRTSPWTWRSSRYMVDSEARYSPSSAS